MGSPESGETTAPTADTEGFTYPSLYMSADQNSLRAQRHFFAATRIRLLFIIAAALFGGIEWLLDGTDAAAVLAAVAFAGAIGAEVYLLGNRPEKTWYDGRAVAESAKTLTWRYVVRGVPFSDSDDQCDERFAGRLMALVRDLPGDYLTPVTDTHDQITSSMRRVRNSPLEERQQLYLQERVRDQQSWYSSKARWNSSRAHAWKVALITIETLGLVGAILRATGVLNFVVLGLAGAIVAAGVAWLQAKQHDTLSRAYSVAAHELGEIASRMVHPITAEEWGDFVDQAEEAISREHTTWRASHA